MRQGANAAAATGTDATACSTPCNAAAAEDCNPRAVAGPSAGDINSAGNAAAAAGRNTRAAAGPSADTAARCDAIRQVA